MLHRSEKRPFSHICQGRISNTARHTYMKMCICVNILNVNKQAKFKANRRRSLQTRVDLTWNDPYSYRKIASHSLVRMNEKRLQQIVQDNTRCGCVNRGKERAEESGI